MEVINLFGNGFLIHFSELNLFVALQEKRKKTTVSLLSDCHNTFMTTVGEKYIACDICGHVYQNLGSRAQIPLDPDYAEYVREWILGRNDIDPIEAMADSHYVISSMIISPYPAIAGYFGQ